MTGPLIAERGGFRAASAGRYLFFARPRAWFRAQRAGATERPGRRGRKARARLARIERRYGFR